MIHYAKTVEKYGYSIDSLTKGSNKKVVISCDYCDAVFDKTFKARNTQNTLLDKDCCSKCKFKKREELCLLKYGVNNSAQRKDIKQKLSQTNIDDHKEQIINLLSQDYSISNISQKLNIPQTSLKRYLKKQNIDTKGDLQKKKEKTFIEKYGNNYSDIFLKKRKHTNFIKYGCDNVFANDKIKDKITQTMQNKYGHNHHMKNQEIKDKVKNTNLDKYGFENVSQSQEIQNKIKKTNIVKYGYEHATQHPDVKNKIVNTMILNGNARLFEGQGASFWAEKTGYCLSRFNQLINQYGFDNAKNMYRTNSYTSLELMFKSFLDDNKLDYNIQQRLNIDNKTYIPDFMLNNLIVEIDGLYWHSDQCRDDDYHINKKTTYEKNDYDSLFFREDEIRDKFDIVKSIVLNKLNKSHRIFARKCTLDQIDNKTADSYFETNHLMGKGRGTTYVLRLNEEIVAAIRLKRVKANHYEISRFCNSKYCSVVGAFSKLLKHCIKDKNPDSIMTFIDKRYGKGHYLKNLGFQYVHTYPSFKWTDGFETFHRLKFSGNSGYDHNLFKIWDCGQAKYILVF